MRALYVHAQYRCPEYNEDKLLATASPRLGSCDHPVFMIDRADREVHDTGLTCIEAITTRGGAHWLIAKGTLNEYVPDAELRTYAGVPAEWLS